MDKQKATYKESTKKQRSRAKKIAQALAVIGIIEFGATYYIATNKQDNDNIHKAPVTKILEKPKKEEVAKDPDTYISETELVDATTILVSELKTVGIDIQNKQALYFIGLINIEELVNTNPDLAKKLFQNVEFNNVKNTSDYVIGEIINASISKGLEINMSSFLFNNDDVEIFDSVTLISGWIDTNVQMGDVNEVNNIVNDNFIRPLYDLNKGFLDINCRRMDKNPTIGLNYLLKTFSSNNIIYRSNEMLNDNTLEILNEMPNDEETIQGLIDVFNLCNQKTR